MIVLVSMQSSHDHLDVGPRQFDEFQGRNRAIDAHLENQLHHDCHLAFQGAAALNWSHDIVKPILDPAMTLSSRLNIC